MKAFIIFTCACVYPRVDSDQPSFLEKVAVGVSTGSSVIARVVAARKTWLSWVNHTLILANVANDALKVEVPPEIYTCRDESYPCRQHRFYYVILETIRRFPEAEWYILADDDIWVNWVNIERQLSLLSSESQLHPNGFAVSQRGVQGFMSGGFYAFDRKAAAILAADVQDCYDECGFAWHNCQRTWLHVHELCHPRNAPRYLECRALATKGLKLPATCYPGSRRYDFGHWVWSHLPEFTDVANDDYLFTYCVISRNITKVFWHNFPHSSNKVGCPQHAEVRDICNEMKHTDHNSTTGQGDARQRLSGLYKTLQGCHHVPPHRTIDMGLGYELFLSSGP